MDADGQHGAQHIAALLVKLDEGYDMVVGPRDTKRVGTNSHIRPIENGIRFLLIIFKIATLYSPLKLFAPIAATLFLTGLGYYGYTFATEHRLTNMSTLLFGTAVITFLIGLISEQITNLTYRRNG